MTLLIDRDGVINQDLASSVRTPAQLTVLPQAGRALALLKAHGINVIVVTNQACVGRGDVSPDTLNAIHTKLLREVRAAGGDIQAIFVCPHTDEDECSCRKPAPGLLLQAADAYDLDLSECYFVGDAARDLAAATAAGATPVLVRTGKGSRVTPAAGTLVFDTLLDAATHFTRSHT